MILLYISKNLPFDFHRSLYILEDLYPMHSLLSDCVLTQKSSALIPASINSFLNCSSESESNFQFSGSPKLIFDNDLQHSSVISF